MKESVESAQFINFKHNMPKINIDDHINAHLNDEIQPPKGHPRFLDVPLRTSHQSNATHLRVESIIDAGSADAKSFANSPLHPDKRFESIYNQLNYGASLVNTTP